jgi:RHS repeat-associated protein
MQLPETVIFNHNLAYSLNLMKYYYEYNAAGDLLKVTNALGNETNITYDSLGRKISMTDPDMGFWQYTYDANGNLKTQTDAKNQTITFVYDALNRVISKSYSTSDPAVTYTYDEPSVPNGIGRLYKVENANAETIIEEYDEMGRELSTSRTVTGAPGNPYTTDYTYDISGKVASMTYPDNYQVNYDYHPGSGLLHTVDGITDFTEYGEFTGYEPTGKIGDIYHGNGAETIYTYDPESTRLLSIQTTDPSLADIQDKAYKYTSAGDITKITDTKGAEVVTYNYAYDQLHRVILETNTGVSDPFDLAVISKTFNGTAPIHAVKSVNSAGVDYAYVYDANGNMTAGWDFSDPTQVAARSITFNADNMPLHIERTYASNTTIVDLVYDGRNTRVKKAVQGGGTIYYIGDHFEVVNGVETKYIFGGNLRIAKVTSINRHFHHKDHLGSSTVMTDYPGGAVSETAEYLPFGLLRYQTGTEVTYYRFTDQELDSEVGLYNYNARLYDPAIGIFINPDSIVPDPFDPQTLNRYSYARNNPLIYVDPSGHFAWFAPVIAGAVGKYI